MNDELSLTQVRLTRSEAARYVGASGESTIRAAEDKGLHCEMDALGQAWHWPAALDAWKWRGKAPSAAQKQKILTQAAKSRQQEERERQRKQALDEERDDAELEAQRVRFMADWDAERALSDKVRRQNEETRKAFEFVHMNARTAGAALGFKSYEVSSCLRELVRKGLLREIPCPREQRVEMTLDGFKEVEGVWPVSSGGPFFLREDVLALRHETLHSAPGPSTSVSHSGFEETSSDALGRIFAALLHAMGEDRTRQQPPRKDKASA
jgi:hypothetical protein